MILRKKFWERGDSMILLLVGLGALLTLCFAYEHKMKRKKMSNDEISEVTLSCSNFLF